MAILKEPTQTRVFDTGDATPPRGTFVAKCIDAKDMFNVQRPKFENPAEMERVDLTAFLFGFRDRSGTPFKIASRSMRISSRDNSRLFAFLKSWLGRPPQYGWDYLELRGTEALITVDHMPSRKYPGVTFADIVSIGPVPEGFGTPATAPTVAAPPPSPLPPAPAPAPVEDVDDPLPF